MTVGGYSCAQQHLLSKGLKVFGNRGNKASMKELDQLHQRSCFAPASMSHVTVDERRKAQVGLTFLTEKRDESVKARMVCNGKPAREWLSREESASPAAVTESAMLASFVDACEQRDAMTADVPDAFAQARLPIKKGNKENQNDENDGNERVMMKTTGVLVDMSAQLNPNLHSNHVVHHNGKKTPCVWVLGALHGMLASLSLWCKKFRKDLESHGCEFNPCDPCVTSRMAKEKQHTIRFHVDDMMSSHRDKEVNTKFGRFEP